MGRTTKWILKLSAASLLLLMLAGGLSKPVEAKTYSENGTWYRKINGTYWYFDINDYTSPAPGEKALGVVYIYKGKKNFSNRKYVGYGEYYKTGTNKYVLKYSGVRIKFTVKARKVVLSQTKGKVRGRKLKGTFKLKNRHYS